RERHTDLTPYGAGASGVSRIHARLSRTGKGITIEDLGSTNGTLLNGYRLQAFTRVPLQDGDALELGHLQFRLRFLDRSL
ncbi:MAG: FHA domain-containing protein, partial [Chloroflexota bacterium]